MNIPFWDGNDRKDGMQTKTVVRNENVENFDRRPMGGAVNEDSLKGAYKRHLLGETELSRGFKNAFTQASASKQDQP